MLVQYQTFLLDVKQMHDGFIQEVPFCVWSIILIAYRICINRVRQLVLETQKQENTGITLAVLT